MLKRSMKVEFVDGKNVLITGDRQTGRTSTSINIIECFLRYNEYAENFHLSRLNINYFIDNKLYRGKKFTLILDCIDYSKLSSSKKEELSKIREEALFVIEIKNNEDNAEVSHKINTIKAPKEPKEDVYVKISEETRKHLEELNELNEELKYASKLSRRYLSYSDSEITKKIKETISKKEHEILVSLGLVKE